MASISRDAFSTATKNTLGSTLTVFSVDNCLEEIERVIVGDDEPEAEPEQDAPPYFHEVESTAQELISDIISQIDPFDFEELVAAVLRAMGYAATRTLVAQITEYYKTDTRTVETALLKTGYGSGMSRF